MLLREGYSASTVIPSFQSDIRQIEHLNNALGIDGKEALLNYNPALAWWKRSRISSESEIQKWREYERLQVVTALRERNHAVKNSATYHFDKQGLAYNPLFPDEPFINVLERGYAYRKENGSPEQERERAEIEGWKSVMAVLSDPHTAEHTKAIIISGPGIAAGTTYKDNFVDIYEAVNDPESKRRVVKMVRHASTLNYGQYLQRTKNLGLLNFPRDNQAIDAWFLAHPTFRNPDLNESAGDIFRHFFQCNRELMSEEDMQKILAMTMPVINYYLNILCSPDFNPEEIALSWNAVLNKNDQSAALIEEFGKNNSLYGLKNIPVLSPSLYQGIRQEVYLLGRKPVNTIAAGCGNSSGLKTNKPGSMSAGEDFLTNSVGMFATGNSPDSSLSKPGDENEEGWINDCGHLIPWEKNTEDKNTWLTHCPHPGCSAPLRKC